MADQETLPATMVEHAHVPATPMEMLSRALDRGADLSVLEKLMDLQERHERNQARKTFDAAVADAKAEIPVIKKNRKGHNSKYADLGAFAAAVDPVLARHGLSYRYRSQQNGSVTVTCILSHRDGHCEETTLSAGADTSGNKNAIQAIASTLTYLQRYTLKLALGLADSEGDDDGRAAGGDAAISADQLKRLQDLASKGGADLEKFCAYFKVESLPDLRQSQFENARVALEAKAKAKASKAKKAEPAQ